jgi:hypothetical protein
MNPTEEDPMTTLQTSEATSARTRTDRIRSALVSGVLALGAVAVAVIVLWQPWGERDHLSYADIAPHRDAAWLGSLIDGLAIAAIGVALGIVACRLAPGRGAAWATVGAVLTGFGGVAFCAGMVSFGSLAWYATDPAAVPPDAGNALLTYAVDHPGHLLGTQMAGFLLYTVGALVLMVALWRARAVPRWLPVAYLVLTLGVFATGGVVLNLVQAAQTLLLIPVAAYALRAAR